MASGSADVRAQGIRISIHLPACRPKSTAIVDSAFVAHIAPNADLVWFVREIYGPHGCVQNTPLCTLPTERAISRI